MDNKFKILSIDGGGIRGVFAAEYLAKLEQSWKDQGKENWQVYQNFNLLAGTSTGGIIAIALSLGIPAAEISYLYKTKGHQIFKKHTLNFYGVLKHQYKTKNLEELLKDLFSKYSGRQPRICDCKVPICIPIYDLQEGEPSFIKTKHNESFNRDYHIPAYMIALATSAAPTYFRPYTSEYINLDGQNVPFRNKVDGGVYCNNPSLSAVTEAQVFFGKALSELQLLSIGTGHTKFLDAKSQRNFGIIYWMKPKQKRLINLFLQAQSQQVQNIISLLEKQGLSNYRIDTLLDGSYNIDLDETSQEKLSVLIEKAHREFQKSGAIISSTFNYNRVK